MTCQFVSDVAAATIQPGGAVGRNIIACKSLFMDSNFTFTSWPLPNSSLGLLDFTNPGLFYNSIDLNSILFNLPVRWLVA